jgi:O-antigen/teichoic acid export membrane protein
VLRFLGLLAAVRLFFELAYDYLVVRGRSRALMVVQAVWLLALVPAVVAGARYFGLVGLAAAQVGVAALVVIPLYLLLLRGSNIRLGLLVRRLLLPLIAGSIVGVAALRLSDVVDSSFWSCAAAGTVALIVIAFLLLLDRRTIARYLALRRAGA